MFRMQRLIALVGLLFPLAVQAAGGQTLGSPVAVLDALKQSRGGVLLAFIDSPSDQANPVKNLQGLLSRYRLDLNGTDLGQVRRNTILHVRPRLGVNRLTIENTFDDQQRKQLSFPAMRAAGVPTVIVEIRTSRDFAWMEALTLSADEVQAVENALNRSQTGGIPRVLALIRSRGEEALQQPRPLRNWSRRLPSGDRSDSHSASDGSASSAVPTQPSSSRDATPDTAEQGTTESDSSGETAADTSNETGDKDSGVSVSADRRSYY
jgi:hypothetical protein